MKDEEKKVLANKYSHVLRWHRAALILDSSQTREPRRLFNCHLCNYWLISLSEYLSLSARLFSRSTRANIRARFLRERS